MSRTPSALGNHPDVAESMIQQFPLDAYPHLAEFSTEHILKPSYAFGKEFEFGLSLILDALARSTPDKGSELSS